MKQFFMAVVDRPGTMLLGSALIVLGWWLSTSPTGDKNVANALLAVGGIVVSAAVSESLGARTARLEYLDKVKIAARRLRSEAVTMHRAMQDLQGNAIDEETAFYALQDGTRRVSDATYELALLCGESGPIGVEEMLDAWEESKKLAAKGAGSGKAAANGGPDPTGELIRAFEERLRALSARHEVSGQATRVEEQVRCPECAAAAYVRLGTTPGDSQMATCSGCGQRFHIHRTAEGGVITRPWAGGRRVIFVTVPCPEETCGNPLEFHFAADETRPQTRFCLSCLRQGDDSVASAVKVNVDPQTKAIMSSSREPILSGRIVEESGPRSQVMCPTDFFVSTAFYKDSRGCFAVCPICRRLILARLEETAGGSMDGPPDCQ